tara:strand:- start:16 stop:372 length:357 start_codon:yes stop_codon:yes gene_type:complete
MLTPIYANQQHKQSIATYLILCKEFVKDSSSKTRYNNYLDVMDIIIEYHNNYGSGLKENNFFDWLMIIPINVSVATNGYFAALETKENASVIRAYKVVLDEMLEDVVAKIDKLEPQND